MQEVTESKDDNEVVSNGGEVGDGDEIRRLSEAHFRGEGGNPRQGQRNAALDQERLHVGAQQGALKCGRVRRTFRAYN